MPKLAAKHRKVVKKADAISGESSFEALDPGKYIATLKNVEAKVSSNGNPMWVAEFEEITDLDGDVKPGRQWYNLMLPQDSMPEDYTPRNSKKSPEEAWENYQAMCAGRLKGFFEAFGYTEDSDTDEMIGEKVVVILGRETIQQGNRKGELTNRVNGVQSLDEVDYEDDEDDDADEF